MKKIFEDFDANQLHIERGIQDLLDVSLVRPHVNMTIPSGNTWAGAGVIVVNKLIRLVTFQVEGEVYPIHINKSASMTFNTADYLQKFGNFARSAGWGTVMHPDGTEGDSRFEAEKKNRYMKHFFYERMRNNLDTVTIWLEMYTNGWTETLAPRHYDEYVEILENEAKFRPAFDAMTDRLNGLCKTASRQGIELHKSDGLLKQLQTAKRSAANRTEIITRIRSNSKRAA